MTELAEVDSLSTMIHDAEQVHLTHVPRPRTVDLSSPEPGRAIVIPEAMLTMLESYELYVD